MIRHIVVGGAALSVACQLFLNLDQGSASGASGVEEEAGVDAAVIDAIAADAAPADAAPADTTPPSRCDASSDFGAPTTIGEANNDNAAALDDESRVVLRDYNNGLADAELAEAVGTGAPGEFGEFHRLSLPTDLTGLDTPFLVDHDTLWFSASRPDGGRQRPYVARRTIVGTAFTPAVAPNFTRIANEYEDSDDVRWLRPLGSAPSDPPAYQRANGGDKGMLWWSDQASPQGPAQLFEESDAEPPTFAIANARGLVYAMGDGVILRYRFVNGRARREGEIKGLTIPAAYPPNRVTWVSGDECVVYYVEGEFVRRVARP